VSLVEAYGARVTLRCPTELLSDLMTGVGSWVTLSPASGPQCPFLEVAAIDASGVGRVLLDGVVVAESHDEVELARRALSELHLAVAVHARGVLFVHAGAVAWRGVGVVLPGRSMAGKSTLVRSLVEAGAQYYSDEYAVLEAEGSLHPYAKPLSIRCPDGSTESILPERVGAVGTAPAPVGVVVSSSYEPDAVWAPELLHGAAAVLPLVHNTVVARLEPERMLEATVAVAEMAMIVESARPEAAETAIAVLALADQVADCRVV
jgi:hypothetical protein